MTDIALLQQLTPEQITAVLNVSPFSNRYGITNLQDVLNVFETSCVPNELRDSILLDWANKLPNTEDYALACSILAFLDNQQVEKGEKNQHRAIEVALKSGSLHLLRLQANVQPYHYLMMGKRLWNKDEWPKKHLIPNIVADTLECYAIADTEGRATGNWRTVHSARKAAREVLKECIDQASLNDIETSLKHLVKMGVRLHETLRPSELPRLLKAIMKKSEFMRNLPWDSWHKGCAEYLAHHGAESERRAWIRICAESGQWQLAKELSKQWCIPIKMRHLRLALSHVWFGENDTSYKHATRIDILTLMAAQAPRYKRLLDIALNYARHYHLMTGGLDKAEKCAMQQEKPLSTEELMEFVNRFLHYDHAHAVQEAKRALSLLATQLGKPEDQPQKTNAPSQMA